ncbi:hypothetical protein SteCoe_20020 [Stentor coeruleus]|uniref:Uncharacterized protein n=1 Tax=Stentor coeruleus TaxID=5963 RepID=A0A1R2BSZ9_9CILI|nr:hypothetical protein SteCoe_20020 [Stentor coeruleus]
MIEDQYNEIFLGESSNGEDLESVVHFSNRSSISTPYFGDNSIETELGINTNANSSNKSSIHTNSVTIKHVPFRASTAPARPLTDIEEFRSSSDFLLLEHTIICASQLNYLADNRYDLESEQGQRCCKKLLNQIEKLCETFKVPTTSRDYRKNFSKAYRVLYKEETLCYLTEILDSAQEAFPYLYVNGEKYVFSNEVLQSGSELFQMFLKIQNSLKEIYSKVYEESFPGSLIKIKEEISEALQDFDHVWVNFEKIYVHELMAIESDARRFITEAIDIEKTLTRFETHFSIKQQVLTDNLDYRLSRGKLVGLIGKINSVANIEGKGRDDLSVEILEAAEGISRRMSNGQSKCVKNIANKISKSFEGLRELLRKYELNIEIVDPQLKNNPDLVEALISFETSWERGKVYLLNSKKCNKLIFLSNYIETLSGSYSVFKEQLECSESELFVTIPGLLVLKCLENEDRGICQSFCPPMFDENESIGQVWKRLKRSYNLGKLASSSSHEYVDLLTGLIIGQQIDNRFRTLVVSAEFDNIDHTLNKIKNLAVEIHRYKPSEWNRFLDIVLS